MADKTIGQLTPASQVTPTDLFVLEQSGTAKKLTGQILENWLVSFADGHGGIQTIEKTGTSGLTDTYTITLADTTTMTFTVTNGKAISSVTTYYAVSSSGSTVPSNWSTTRQSMTSTNKYLWSYQRIAFNDGTNADTTKTVIGVYGDKGNTGDTGVGISTLTQTSRVPGVSTTYTFTMTDGSTKSFISYDGAGIEDIQKTSTVGLVDTYTVTLTNEETESFTVTNGKSIDNIAWTSNSGGGTQGDAGTYDTYTITYNDGDTSTFRVYNGINGTGAVSTVDGIASVGQDVPLLTIGNGPPTTTTPGNIKSRYFDATNSILYFCTAVNTNTNPTTYTWKGSGVTVDSALSTMSTNPVQNAVIANKIGQLETSIASKLPYSGGTMNGNIVMANHKITNLGTPTANGDAVNKSYVDSNYRTATAQDAIDAAQNAAIAGIILESTGDSTDRTAEILSRLTTYKKCILGTGTFYTTGINMPNDSSLIGCGDATILLKTGNGDYVVKMNQRNTVSNLHINGNDNDVSATIGTHHGILWLGDYSTSETPTLPQDGKISNLTIENCNGGGITCNDTGMGRYNNLVACNIAITTCGVGINIPFLSEYHRFTNIDVWYCYYGCINNGGNNCFVNCDFSDSRVIGFVIDNSNGDKTNNSHGTCVGCSFNHIGNNDGLALSLNGVTAGFTFSNCNIFRGSVEIISSMGVAIADSLFGKSITITVTDSQAIQFANDTFQGAPTLAISGSSYPHFRDCFNYTTGASILNSELTTILVQHDYTVLANDKYTANLKTIIDNALPSGYACAGITGVQSGNENCFVYSARYVNSAYALGIKNLSSSKLSNVTASFAVLCKPI